MGGKQYELMKTYLAVSLLYPPFAEIRGVQVDRLLSHSPQRWLIAHGTTPVLTQDPTTASPRQRGPRERLAIPVPPDLLLAKGLRKLGRTVLAHLPGLRQGSLGPALQSMSSENRMPDRYRAWIGPAQRAVGAWLKKAPHPPQAVLGIGQPWSSLVAASRISRQAGLPLLAFFSDPWADHVALNYDLSPKARRLSAEMEAQVVEQAVKLLFPSQNLADFVMAKYPPAWHDKVRILPHCFDPERYGPFTPSPDGIKYIRFLGSFYKRRSPQPFLRGLARALELEPGAFSQVRFQCIGPDTDFFQPALDAFGFPPGLVEYLPRVSYQRSLELMAASHALLIMDPEIDYSPFLSAKLIDYLGSGRPICAIHSQGQTEGLVRELGGWTAPFQDPEAVARMLLAAAASPSLPVRSNETLRAYFSVEAAVARLQATLDE